MLTNPLAVIFLADSYMMVNLRPKIVAAAEASTHCLGFRYFKEEQKEAVVFFVLGKVMLVLIPTGSRKCLCYSLLLWTFDELYQTPAVSITVVSLLVSLIMDQSNSATHMGTAVTLLAFSISTLVTLIYAFPHAYKVRISIFISIPHYVVYESTIGIACPLSFNMTLVQWNGIVYVYIASHTPQHSILGKKGQPTFCRNHEPHFWVKF